MNEIITLIQNSKDFCMIGASDSDAIDNAEKKLGVKLASDYRLYVENFGAASFDGRELTGICNSNRLSVISATERARAFYPHFPSNAYVVEELQFDHIVIIQNPAGNVFSYGPADKEKMVAKTLREYLFPESI